MANTESRFLRGGALRAGFVGVCLLLGGFAMSAKAAPAAEVSQPTYKTKIERTVRVKMRDGVELAAVIVRPDEDGKFPAIMSYNPYRRVDQVRSKSDDDYNHHVHGAPYFAERGYVVVHYDVRGTGNSGGSTQDIYSDQERQDAYDMIEWIGVQPWCTGKVGMWGMSYGGVVQWQVGVQNPPHLATLVVGSSNDDVYLDWTYPGGSLRPYMFDSFSPLMTARNFVPPSIDFVGDKWSELWNERLEKNVPWGVGFISHQLRDKYWLDRSLQPDYSRIKVPVMVWSGWADCYPTPILRAFSKVNVPKKAFVGPWGHWYWERALPGPQVDGRHEFLKWYDYWLKGIDTGVMDEPPVTLWVKTYKKPEERMYITDAGSFRFENEWPLKRTQYTTMYFDEGGVLGREKPAAKEGKDSYEYDATVGVTSGIYWGGGVLPYAQPVDQRYDDALSLTYTTGPLAEDTELTGDPKVVLYISSTADAAYFHAKIIDVAPDGTAKWVVDGGLLASHRNAHAKPEPLEPGKVYEVRPDMKYMAYVFPKGHRIRVSIASADFQNAWPVAKKAVNTIYRGAGHASHVILPIAPAQSPKLAEVKFLPSPRATPTDESIPKSGHTITHDLVNGTVTVSLEAARSETAEGGRMGSRELTTSTYTVSKNSPADAELNARHEYVVMGPDGDIEVVANEVVSSDISSFRYLVDVHVTVGGKPHFEKSWRVSVPRKLN